MTNDFIFTSESVTDGHPDKLCDQISDAIVDAFLVEDPLSRVVAECAVAKGIVFIAARFASDARIDLAHVARAVIDDAGYTDESFNARDCSVMTSLNELPLSSAERGDERGLDDAGLSRVPAFDQVTLFGFACTQTAALMPLPIWLAHKLARRLAESRRDGSLPYLTPDGKTQVSVEYRDRRPVRIHGISVTTTTAPGQTLTERRLSDEIRQAVIEPVFAEEESLAPDVATTISINPGDPFAGGGPARHSGMTGRKTGIDTYGEYARHSGAALSGKDPSRIDRVGAYAARNAAKSVVAAGLASECEVQVSYAIGLSAPVSVQVATFGSGRQPDAEIATRVRRCFDFRPAAVVARFDLRHRPQQHGGRFYRTLAAYGHMGRVDIETPWESIGGSAALTD